MHSRLDYPIRPNTCYACYVKSAFAQTGTGTITYDSASNTITVAGFPASNPAHFSDLWHANQESGWGVISQQSFNSYTVSTHIAISSGTYLNDTDIQLTFNGDIIRANADFFISGGGFLTLGSVDDMALKTSSHGCNLSVTGSTYYFNWIYTGGSYIYSSSFYATGKGHAILYANTVWNSYGTGQGFDGFRPSFSCDFYNVTAENTYYGLYLYAVKAMAQKTTFTFKTAALLLESGAIKVTAPE